MRKRVQTILGAAVMTLALTTPALPQAPSSTTAQPVKVQIVFSTGEANGKVSMPYTLMTSSSGEYSALRIGAEVPLLGPGFDGQTRVTLQQFGTQIDCSVTATDDGRFKLALNITRRFLSPGGQPRTFVSVNTVTLRDGESTQFTGTDNGESSSDKSSVQTFTVDVTLTVLK